MAEFDDVMAGLLKKLAAIQAVLDKHPNIRSEVNKEFKITPDPQVEEAARQEEAKANALRNLMEQTVNKTIPDPDVNKTVPDTALVDEIASHIE